MPTSRLYPQLEQGGDMPSDHGGRGNEPAKYRVRNDASDLSRWRAPEKPPQHAANEALRDSVQQHAGRRSQQINGAATVMRRRCCTIWIVRSWWSRVARGDAAAAHSKETPLMKAARRHRDSKFGRTLRN